MKTIQAPDGKQYKLAYRTVEMGCVAMIKGHKKGCNEGRIVRVFLPLAPSERYGHAQRKAPSSKDHIYWQVVAVDGTMLEYTQAAAPNKKLDTTVAVRTGLLRRLKEIE